MYVKKRDCYLRRKINIEPIGTAHNIPTGNFSDYSVRPY